MTPVDYMCHTPLAGWRKLVKSNNAPPPRPATTPTTLVRRKLKNKSSSASGTLALKTVIGIHRTTSVKYKCGFVLRGDTIN